ncbi:hypothetical protein NQD34_016905 [Periophthalmus magnuspinnatus]|uniref:uncharacterized protein si:ch211-214j24.14 n=1 Tax=Periophthalmus magnuspinnatus TaxID=409849 RepID=UPI0022CBE8AE|nr:uncharacterized protein si:ch211-214j24.14 [Periophthalmus magnuspinnatus]KAJ0012571.1 hypothetical protein NQD34_016905 [Periophthalmus magnuspinnatus]
MSTTSLQSLHVFIVFVSPFFLTLLFFSAFDQTKKTSLHFEDSEIILEGKHPNETREGSGEGEVGSFTPPPLTHMDRPGPWQSESFLVSSWSTMEDADTQSLGSSDSGTPAADEDHSSSEAEPLGPEEEQEPEKEHRDEEPMTSGLSQFSVESEEDIQAPQTSKFMQVVPPMALPPLPILQLDPPSNSSTPVLSSSTGDPEELLSTPLGLHPPSILAPINPPIVKTAADDPESSQKHSDQASSPQREHFKSKPAKTQTFIEVPVLLCGGAALVAVVGVMAYGAVALLRK